MTKRQRTAVSAAVMTAVLLSASGCAKAEEPFKDAPRANTNDSPADVIQMPDGFNNLASKCDHGNRIYVTYHADSPYGAVAVVPNDPQCTGESGR